MISSSGSYIEYWNHFQIINLYIIFETFQYAFISTLTLVWMKMIRNISIENGLWDHATVLSWDLIIQPMNSGMTDAAFLTDNIHWPAKIQEACTDGATQHFWSMERDTVTTLLDSMLCELFRYYEKTQVFTSTKKDVNFKGYNVH